MKRFSVLFLICVIPLLVACSSGGGGGLDSAINPYGFVVTSFDTASANTLTNQDIRSTVRPTTTGLMYAGTANGLFSFNPDLSAPTFTKNTDAGLTNQSINKIVADGIGDMYICTDSGLFKYTATTASITAVPGFGGVKVLSFARQATSTFWVGLEDLTATTNSVAKVDNGAITFYGTAKGMTASTVSDIFVDSTTIMACGTGSTGKAGLFRFDTSGDQFVKQVTNIGLASGATLFFKIGTAWYAGGPNSGLITSADSGNAWTQTNLTTQTPYSYTPEIVSSNSSTRYWIGTDKGAYLTYDMVNFVLYSTTNGLAGDSARGVSQSSSTVMWVANDGVSGGLSRLAFSGN